MKFGILCCFFCLQFTGYGQDKAIIEARVLMANAQPVPNAVVNLLNSQFEGYTNSSGNFTLKGVPSGIYILNVQKVSGRSGFIPENGRFLYQRIQRKELR